MKIIAFYFLFLAVCFGFFGFWLNRADTYNTKQLSQAVTQDQYSN